MSEFDERLIEVVARAICHAGNKYLCSCVKPEKCRMWNWHKTEASAALRAAYEALEREGWQQTPAAATDEMLRAASHYSDRATAHKVWLLMSAAAPKPPGAG